MDATIATSFKVRNNEMMIIKLLNILYLIFYEYRFLTNEPSADYSIHDIYDNYPIKLWYNGSVQFTPSLHLNTECLFSYARFPFDYQLCSFRVK